MFHIISGLVTIACDCNGALLRALVYNQHPNTGTSNFDIIWAIYNICRDLPIDIKTQQVEAHLDKRDLNRILNRWERLNCRADIRAKEFVYYVLLTKGKPVTRLYGLQWRVSINGDFIHKKLREKIYNARHKKYLQNCMVEKINS